MRKNNKALRRINLPERAYLCIAMAGVLGTAMALILASILYR